MNRRMDHTAPAPPAQRADGAFSFKEWIVDSWAVLISHRKDFTPASELGYMAKASPGPNRGDVTVEVSLDRTSDDEGGARCIEEAHGQALDNPILRDVDLQVARLDRMLPATVEGGFNARTLADNQTVREVCRDGSEEPRPYIRIVGQTG